MAFNTNGDLSSAYTGIPYKNVQPYNTNSGLNTTSTTVPSVGADFKEHINAASSSQAGIKELIEDYKKKIADIDKNIATLTAEKNKIKANDFSDEERRMIESYTTLGDLDAGVKEIMTSRQFKSALDQTQANETQANTEAKDRKELIYNDAVTDAAAFAVKHTDLATGLISEAAQPEYGSLITKVRVAATDAGIKKEVANEAVKVKVAEMRKAGADGNKNPDAADPLAKAVDDIIAKYYSLRMSVKDKPFEKTDLTDPERNRLNEVQAAIDDLYAESKRIDSLTGITRENKIKYEGLIEPMIKDLAVYSDAAIAAAKAIGNASTRKDDIATAKAKVKEGYEPLRSYLLSGIRSADNVLKYLSITAETVRDFETQEEMFSLSAKINELK